MKRKVPLLFSMRLKPLTAGLLRLVLLAGIICLLGALAFAQVQSKSPRDEKTSLIQESGTKLSLVQSDLASKKVLILHAFAYAQPAYKIIDQSLIESFIANGINFNNLHIEFLDFARNPGQEYRNELFELLRRKHKARKLDLVLTLHQEALQFLLKEGQNVYPEGPIISILGDVPFSEHSDSKRPIIHLPASIDAIATAKTIFILPPDSQKILVIAGSSASDRQFGDFVQAQLQAWKGGLEVEYIPALPLGEVLKKVAHLPAGSLE